MRLGLSTPDAVPGVTELVAAAGLGAVVVGGGPRAEGAAVACVVEDVEEGPAAITDGVSIPWMTGCRHSLVNVNRASRSMPRCNGCTSVPPIHQHGLQVWCSVFIHCSCMSVNHARAQQSSAAQEVGR